MNLINKKERILLGASVFFSIVGALLLMQAMITMGRVMDMAIKSDIHGMGKEVVWAVVYIVGELMAEYFALLTAGKYQYGVRTSVILKIVRNLFSMPMSKIKEKNSDFYMNLLNNDVEYFRIEYVMNLYTFLTSLIAVITASITLTRIHIFILIAALVLTLIPIFFSNLMTKHTVNINKERSEANEAFLMRLSETTAGFDVIKRSNRAESYIDVFEKANTKRTDVFRQYFMIMNMVNKTMRAIGSMDQLLLIAVCSYLVLNNLISPGMIITAVASLAHFSDSFSNALEYRMGMKAAKVYSDKFIPYLEPQKNSMSNQNNEAMVVDTAIDNDRNNSESVISVRNLDFSYGDHKIFDDFSLDIKKNELVAILGQSGSGKSTLINLLLKTSEDH